MPFQKLIVGDFKSAIDQTISHIKELKAEAEAAGREFRVIDVGGGRWGKKWDGLITAAVDLVAPDSDTDGAVSGIQHFQIDIDDESSWLAQEAELLKNGKYDFCVCRHTLEDLNHPATAAKWLQKIAKKGAIGVPSYLIELGLSSEHLWGPGFNVAEDTTVEGQRGYLHHKWIFFAGKNDTLIAYPKMSWINCFDDGFYEKMGVPADMSTGGFFNAEPFPQDFTLFWEDDFKYLFLNNNMRNQFLMYPETKKKLSSALGFEDIEAEWTKAGLDWTAQQDWVLLGYLTKHCGLSDEVFEGFRKRQENVKELFRGLGLAVNEEPRYPWYTISVAMGWGFEQPDDRTELPWIFRHEDGTLRIDTTILIEAFGLNGGE